jgi:hypothetical protein
MAAFAHARDADVPDALTAAWASATARWDEPAAHDELLRLVTQHDAYAWAAAHYRDVARARPTDAIAERELARVRRAAEVTLLASAAPRREKAPYGAATAVLALLIILAITAFVYALVRRGMQADDEPPPPPAPRATTR